MHILCVASLTKYAFKLDSNGQFIPKIQILISLYTILSVTDFFLQYITSYTMPYTMSYTIEHYVILMMTLHMSVSQN